MVGFCSGQIRPSDILPPFGPIHVTWSGLAIPPERHNMVQTRPSDILSANRCRFVTWSDLGRSESDQTTFFSRIGRFLSLGRVLHLSNVCGSTNAPGPCGDFFKRWKGMSQEQANQMGDPQPSLNPLQDNDSNSRIPDIHSNNHIHQIRKHGLFRRISSQQIVVCQILNSASTSGN